MFFLLIPLFTRDTHLSYPERMEMIRSSFSFKSSKTNFIYGYVLFVVNMIPITSIGVHLCLNEDNMTKILYFLYFFIIVNAFSSSFFILSAMDAEDRINRNENLLAEELERLENVSVETGEEIGNSQQVSVDTNFLNEIAE